MRITVLAICYNEEKMLPYFLKHYLEFADKIVVYDNMSTDKSRQIISSFRNTEIVSYDTSGKLDDKTYLKIKNKAWKKYRNETDWQIIVDMDEFLYHPHILSMLRKFEKEGITVPLTRGYNMVASSFPRDKKRQLFQIIKRGVFSPGMSKLIVFNPKKIKEINFGPGAHNASPRGEVKYSKSSELLLLHYKYFGLRYFRERAKLYAKRLKNVDYDWGQREYIKQQNADLKMYQRWSRYDEAEQILFSSRMHRFFYKVSSNIFMKSKKKAS